MAPTNYNRKIELYFQRNPNLSTQALAVLLTADRLYKNLSQDLTEFREKYAHLDPEIIDKHHDGIFFLKMVGNQEPVPAIRDMLNNYVNIKFNDIEHSKSYEKNMVTFKKYSILASRIIDELLAKTLLPRDLVSLFQETDDVKTCCDFFEMLLLYKKNPQKRIRFELLRKLGLIVLIARINRSVEVEELDNRLEQVFRAFKKGLGLKKEKTNNYYFWLNAEDRIQIFTDKNLAGEEYKNERRKLNKIALEIHPMNSFRCSAFRSFSGNEILHMEVRNKFKCEGKISYTSFVQKMLRRNLEFPNMVHDTIGVRIIVNSEDDIKKIIMDLETFIGGSSTRKMERASYHRFGRRGLSEYSSKDYFVWKAIYDITLPNPSIDQIDKMIEITSGNNVAQRELKKRRRYFIHNPLDYVIEVQLQDIKSYLLSMAAGSPTEHAKLKMNQIRSNTFYKVFPKEVYESDVATLKQRLLNHY